MVNISGDAIHEWVLHNLPNNSIIVEAGTADGNDTLFFSNHCANGKIYGFEPEPVCFKESINKVGARANVEVLNVALSDKSGTSTLYVSDRFGELWGSSSLLKPKEHLRVHTEISFKKEISVQTINLDEWFQAKDLHHIDLLWLDMQGAEPLVLRSSPIALSKTKYLYTEVSLIDTYENVEKYESFKLFLNESGFDIIGEELPWVDMGNILLKNRNVIS
jgi:FkbM family methyltransferase